MSDNEALIPEVMSPDDRDGLTPIAQAKIYEQFLMGDLTIRELSMDPHTVY